MAHGGRDPWLRVPHTLIILGRLADRDLITEQERSELSDAYAFLRMLEHRVQMEHGLQTHIVPQDVAAARVGGAPHELLRARTRSRNSTARWHCMRATFIALTSECLANGKPLRVRSLFGAGRGRDPSRHQGRHQEKGSRLIQKPQRCRRQQRYLRLMFCEPPRPPAPFSRSLTLLQHTARQSLNQRRALMLTARIASSLDKTTDSVES